MIKMFFTIMFRPAGEPGKGQSRALVGGHPLCGTLHLVGSCGRADEVLAFGSQSMESEHFVDSQISAGARISLHHPDYWPKPWG